MPDSIAICTQRGWLEEDVFQAAMKHWGHTPQKEQDELIQAAKTARIRAMIVHPALPPAPETPKIPPEPLKEAPGAQVAQTSVSSPTTAKKRPGRPRKATPEPKVVAQGPVISDTDIDIDDVFKKVEVEAEDGSK